MADETAGDSMDQNETTDSETDAVETPRAFSQQDVDRIVQDRLARDRRDRPSDTEIQPSSTRARGKPRCAPLSSLRPRGPTAGWLTRTRSSR